MSGIEGDFRAFHALGAAISTLPETGKVVILDAAARHLVELTKRGFTLGIAPDESRWAPVKRGGQPLVKTGKLMGSFVAEMGNDTVSVGTGTFYAPFHQSGTKKMPARKMLPEPGTLPPGWASVLGQAFDEALADAVRKALGLANGLRRRRRRGHDRPRGGDPRRREPHRSSLPHRPHQGPASSRLDSNDDPLRAHRKPRLRPSSARHAHSARRGPLLGPEHGHGRGSF